LILRRAGSYAIFFIIFCTCYDAAGDADILLHATDAFSSIFDFYFLLLIITSFSFFLFRLFDADYFAARAAAIDARFRD